jgi:ABC-2 type transport system permease protein
MKKILLILQREYLVRVKKRSFILMTFLTPLIFAGLIVLSTWLATSSKFKEDKVIRVLDESALFVDLLEGDEKLRFTPVKGDYESNYKAFKESEDFALLYIPNINKDKPVGIKLLGKKSISMDLQLDIEKKMRRILEDNKLLEAGIDKKVLEQTKSKVSIETKVLGGDSEESSSSIAVYIVGFGAAFLIYLSVFIYGAQVMRGVIEEKTNRIVEVIISSVKPMQLLLGKILGIAMVGLTQFLLWIILTFVLVSFGGAMLGGGELPKAQMEQLQKQAGNDENLAAAQENIQAAANEDNKVAKLMSSFGTVNFPLIIFSFLFYFVFGYLLYSSMFAAAGSAGDSETDAQQFTAPISMPLILSFIMAQTIISEPDGAVAFWLSMVPLTSPIVMMIRIPYGVPVWELVLSMSLLVGGFLAITWVAARIYRVGILMYGKKVTYKDLGKWIFYKQ